MSFNQNAVYYLIQYNSSIREEYLSIIRPFSTNFGINFGYTRVYYDGRYCDLRPEIDFLKISYEYDLNNKGKFFIQEIGEVNSNNDYVSIWPTMPDDPYLEGLYEHDIWQGFEICEKKKDFIEICTFGTARDRGNFLNFYVNNFVLLKKMVLYFKEKGSFFLDRIDKNSLPVSTLYQERLCLIQDKARFNKDIFFNDISSNNLKDYNSCFSHLSKREIQCLLCLSSNKTSKETGKTLGISYRTVEKYIESLKMKLNCYSKNDLKEFVVKNQLELNLSAYQLKSII